MLDHYLLCLSLSTNSTQIDALATKAWESLSVADYTKFLDAACNKLDQFIDNTGYICPGQAIQ